jgi:hypothetical protein
LAKVLEVVVEVAKEKKEVTDDVPQKSIDVEEVLEPITNLSDPKDKALSVYRFIEDDDGS